MGTSVLSRSRTKSRHGLTLMELVVVMMILVAVAGALAPLFDGMLTRAHASTSADSLQEITKAVQMYQVRYFGYPDGLDNLATGSGAIGSFVPGASGTHITASPLGANALAALNAAGVNTVIPVVESGSIATWNATFAPYATLPPAAVALTASTEVATLSASAAAELGLPIADGEVYVVFGLGAYSEMKGKGLDSAPVHFADNQTTADPTKHYARYGLVFKVDTTQPLDKAEFATAIAFHEDGLENRDAHLAEYYSAK